MSNLLGTIGNTPLIKLNTYSDKNVEVFAKLEGLNPAGSIKDRVAFSMITDAEERGLLQKGSKILEATSGNTGIGLAMIAAARGYSFTAVMPESASLERRKILSAYGANIILTDGEKGTDYSYQVAQQMLSKDSSYVMLNQFENSANPMTHYATTGKEIIEQLPTVTHLVVGLGTGGTITGTGKKLKEHNRKIQVIGVKPQLGKKIQGLRDMSTFIPSVFDRSVVNRQLETNNQMATIVMKDLVKSEGLFVGFSSAAALWGVIQLKQTLKSGRIVTIFPDMGSKYLSMNIF